MKRTDPTFKTQTQSSEEDTAFINELFDSLFDSLTDNAPIDSDTDRTPDLSAFHDAA
jgi:hypothetical protein